MISELAKKYFVMVEQFICDIETESSPEYEYDKYKAEMRDAVYDISCDRIFDDMMTNQESCDVIDHDSIRAAATEISEYFFGKAGS